MQVGIDARRNLSKGNFTLAYSSLEKKNSKQVFIGFQQPILSQGFQYFSWEYVLVFFVSDINKEISM